MLGKLLTFCKLLFGRPNGFGTGSGFPVLLTTANAGFDDLVSAEIHGLFPFTWDLNLFGNVIAPAGVQSTYDGPLSKSNF